MENESEENGQSDSPKARIGDLVSVELFDPNIGEALPPLSDDVFKKRVLMCLMRIAEATEKGMNIKFDLGTYDYGYGPVYEVVKLIQAIGINSNHATDAVQILQMIATSLSDMALHLHEGVKSVLNDEIQKALIEENVALRKKLAELESKGI